MAAHNYRIRLMAGGHTLAIERHMGYDSWFRVSMSYGIEDAKRKVEDLKRRDAVDDLRRKEMLKELGPEGILYIE